ncbi:MAG: hypothetical protein D3909_05375 [Candidatus Electrothrix sp. ATG1]|nr:hypothetical protein [Candidatus Electrothrix sp. ATG1]
MGVYVLVHMESCLATDRLLANFFLLRPKGAGWACIAQLYRLVGITSREGCKEPGCILRNSLYYGKINIDRVLPIR